MTESQTGYMPNLSLISLDAFKHDLRTGRLLPSRRPLLDQIDESFAALERAGIQDLAAAQTALGSAGRLKALAAKTGISEDYLKLLRREINSVLPTPVGFHDVSNIPDEILLRLDDMGIADTAALFPYVRSPAHRKAFAIESGLPDEDVLWLAKFVDVSRIKWAGPKLTRLIVDTEFDTVEKLANAEPAVALGAFKRAKAENKAYDGPLGIDDIESWIKQIIRKMPKAVTF